MERSSWQAVFWRVQAPCRHAAGLTEARTPPSLARMEMPSSRSKATGPEMLAGEVVVVLEDDELVRRATERLLRRFGAEVVAGRSAGEVLESLTARGLVPSCIVVDFWLSREENGRSEEHTSELQSLMRNSYAVFCLKKKK